MGNEAGEWIIHGVKWNDPKCIQDVDEAVEYINRVGFLPIFKNEIPGFSLEERTVAEYWWSDDPVRDPWRWRIAIAKKHDILYGKFFAKKPVLFPKCGYRYLPTTAGTDMITSLPAIRRIRLAQGDIRPTDVAPVIGQSEHGLELGICRWGYPLSKSKGLVINARVETVLDKPSFQNGILYHRLLIPAGGFYEWNSLKEKSIFTRLDSSVLYMAGFCDWFDNSKMPVLLQA